MNLLGFGVATLVGIKHGEIVQDRGDVGMVRAELFLVNLERVQIVRLGGLLPSGLPKNERDIVQDRTEVGIREIVYLATNGDRAFIKPDGFFRLAELIAQKRQPPRGTKQRPLVRQLRFFPNGIGREQMALGRDAVAVGYTPPSSR